MNNLSKCPYTGELLTPDNSIFSCFSIKDNGSIDELIGVFPVFEDKDSKIKVIKTNLISNGFTFKQILNSNHEVKLSSKTFIFNILHQSDMSQFSSVPEVVFDKGEKSPINPSGETILVANYPKAIHRLYLKDRLTEGFTEGFIGTNEEGHKFFKPAHDGDRVVLNNDHIILDGKLASEQPYYLAMMVKEFTSKIIDFYNPCNLPRIAESEDLDDLLKSYSRYNTSKENRLKLFLEFEEKEIRILNKLLVKNNQHFLSLTTESALYLGREINFNGHTSIVAISAILYFFFGNLRKSNNVRINPLVEEADQLSIISSLFEIPTVINFGENA